MKFKKMIDLCKKRGFFHLFVPTGGERWISDGAGCYQLGDVPMMDEDILCAICDIPEKAREKMRFLEGEAPHNLCFDDVDESESLCDEYPLVFGEGKDGVIPYRTSQGIQFIAKKYMAPLEDCDRVEVYERISKGGRMYFAVKRGYSLVALIMPYDIISEPFVKDIENLAALCKVALQNQKAAEEEQVRIGDDDAE